MRTCPILPLWCHVTVVAESVACRPARVLEDACGLDHWVLEERVEAARQVLRDAASYVGDGGVVLEYTTPIFIFLSGCDACWLLPTAELSDNFTGIPQFKCVKSFYQPWITAACGWIAMKYPDLISLIQGEWEEPDEPDDDAPETDAGRI